MITGKFRHGFGFDIEHNEDVIHYVGDPDDAGDYELAAFQGLIIKLPFVCFYIGDFYELK